MAENKKKSQKKRSAGKKSSSSKAIKPLKSSDIPVTQKMLYGVRDELKSDIASVRLEMRADFKKVDARFKSIDARFDEVLSEVKKQSAQTNRMLTLIEEQENRNKFVLDGYRSLNDRLEPLERAIAQNK